MPCHVLNSVIHKFRREKKRTSHHLPNKMMKSTCQHIAMELVLLRCHFLQNLVQNPVVAGSYLDSNQKLHTDPDNP